MLTWIHPQRISKVNLIINCERGKAFKLIQKVCV
jgi:hypothetical protein